MFFQGNTENPETPSDDDKDNAQLKKTGFFSSVRNLVSDFTENIIKDFQEEEQLSGKTCVSHFFTIECHILHSKKMKKKIQTLSEIN